MYKTAAHVFNVCVVIIIIGLIWNTGVSFLRHINDQQRIEDQRINGNQLTEYAR